MDTRCTCRIVKAPTYEVYVQEPCGIHRAMVEKEREKVTALELQIEEVRKYGIELAKVLTKERDDANRLVSRMQKVIDAALVVNAMPLTTPRTEREKAELRLWYEVDEYSQQTEKR